MTQNTLPFCTQPSTNITAASCCVGKKMSCIKLLLFSSFLLNLHTHIHAFSVSSKANARMLSTFEKRREKRKIKEIKKD